MSHSHHVAVLSKSKVVPMLKYHSMNTYPLIKHHTIKSYGRVEVSGQLHAPDTLSPGKAPTITIG